MNDLRLLRSTATSRRNCEANAERIALAADLLGLVDAFDLVAQDNGQLVEIAVGHHGDDRVGTDHP
ncbi:MAG: hypothetical protein ABIR32_15800, partial [Ilumatobacteraceae bacterium]